MREYARKRAKSGLSARSSALTTQIKADLVPDLRQAQYGHFARLPKNGGMRCKPLKMRAFPAALRLPSEQIGAYHFGLSL